MAFARDAMEPRIQYAEAKDGVNIAYCTLGEGMPFVEIPVPPWGVTRRLGLSRRHTRSPGGLKNLAPLRSRAPTLSSPYEQTD